jgi:hypothetical protein
MLVTNGFLRIAARANQSTQSTDLFVTDGGEIWARRMGVRRLTRTQGLRDRY